MKRIISFVTAVIIAFFTLASPACADKEAVVKFKDVKDTDWFAEAVGKLSALDIVNGMVDGSFNPQSQVTRAQFVKMLVQAMEYKKTDSLSFEDLKPFKSSKPHWASVYVETALRNGVIVKSEIGENFYPDVPLTRKDMGMMMFRALKLEPSIGNNPFADLSEANGYFLKLYEEYLVRGTPAGNNVVFEPEGLTTRAQAAVIISRMADYKADPVAFKTKTKKEELKTAVGENGVPLRLYEYIQGTTTSDAKGTYQWTFRERNQAYYDKFEIGSVDRYGYPEVAKFADVDSFIKYQVDIAKRYMKYNWDIDYRNIGQAYIDGIGDTLSLNSAYHAEKNIRNFKKYKVVCKSEFFTDYDLIYERDGMATSLRGTLRVKFEKGTSKEFIKDMFDADIEAGKWYDIDLEVPLARDSVDKTWYVRRNNSYTILGISER